MSPSLALKAIYTTCQKLNLVPKGLLAFKPKCMIMTGPADRLSWFSKSELVFGCWPIEHMTYLKLRKKMFLQAQQIHKMTTTFTQPECIYIFITAMGFFGDVYLSAGQH